MRDRNRLVWLHLVWIMICLGVAVVVEAVLDI